MGKSKPKIKYKNYNGIFIFSKKILIRMYNKYHAKNKTRNYKVTANKWSKKYYNKCNILKNLELLIVNR